MPFLPPDQQRQSTEGTFYTIIMRLKLRMVVYSVYVSFYLNSR